jgi:hypothetical protein
LDFYVVFWVAQLVCEEVGYAFSVVALEYDLVVFGGSSAGAEGFHFLGQATHVVFFGVYAIYDGDWSSEFPGF